MAPEVRTERELSLDFLRVTEAAAIAAARTMGQGNRKYSDQVAVEAMREVMDSVPMRGRVVIGEGERDEAPMLYIGEEVGGGFGVGEEMAASCPEVDIAVDPLEGTNLCALGANNAIAVLAAAERGGLLHAPDIYMDKIVVGPSSRGVIDIDAPVKENLKNIARRLGRDVEDLTVIRRSFGGHFRRGGGHQHSRLYWYWRRARRRPDCGGSKMFERRDSGAIGFRSGETGCRQRQGAAGRKSDRAAQIDGHCGSHQGL